MEGGGDSCFEIMNWDRVEVLGRGSQGVVYKAVPIIGIPYFIAIKSTLLKYSSSLVREEIILSNFIGCPEIIQYIGSSMGFEGESFAYPTYNLALEYATGGTLNDLITRRGRLPESEVKDYLRMIVRGLCTIHERGFVHCDLKPANILAFLEGDGKVKLKIADFGLSKRFSECEKVVICTNAKPSFRGTPEYMSPESVLFGNINPAVDIWSLGCILFEMISRKPLWDDYGSLRQLLKKLLHEMELPDIPEELSREGRDFFAGCIDQNVERRWTAKMLLQHPYIKEECTIAETPSTWNLPDLLDINWSFEEGFHESRFELNLSDPLYT